MEFIQAKLVVPPALNGDTTANGAQHVNGNGAAHVLNGVTDKPSSVSQNPSGLNNVSTSSHPNNDLAMDLD
jgi:hypothetical protein